MGLIGAYWIALAPLALAVTACMLVLGANYLSILPPTELAISELSISIITASIIP